MALSDETWTGQQRQAIATLDRSVLVGAAAGSGKTAVLARRCAYLVSEAPPEFRCDLDDLLVVTFTEAAAAEMRTRIGRAIRDQLAERPGDPRLRYQLAALDGTAISTIHSFCRQVLTRWFAAAELDPDVDLLDPDEQLLLQQDAVEQVFAELYAQAGPLGTCFRELIDLYGEGRDRPIADRVIWLAEYFNSIVDPHVWRQQARDWLAVPKPGKLPPDLARALCRRLQQELGWQRRDCLRAVELIRSRYPSASYLADPLQGHADHLARWSQRAASLDSASLDRLTTLICDYKFPAKRRGPRLPQDAPQHLRRQRDSAAAWHTRVGHSFHSRLQKRWGQFTVAEMAEGLSRVRPFVDTLLELVERFAARYRRLKDQDGRLDFADLERRTLGLLSADGGDNPAVRSLRKRFRYVCVDEFQDVNPVQERILRLVSGESSPDRPDNLFCVGDVKQSIYRFRLAEPSIFVARQNRLRREPEAGRFIPLGENFRSRAGLLDGVNAVFERLMSAEVGPIVYDSDARLRPGLSYPPGAPDAPCLEMHLLERKIGPDAEEESSPARDAGQGLVDWEVIEREAYLVGRRILQLMEPQPGGRRATVCLKPSAPGEQMGTELMDFRHVVVLLRSRRHKAEHLARVLARMGVPVHVELATGYFESTEVRDLLALLALLDNRQQDIPLAAVMRSPLFAPRFDESDLVRVRTIDRECPFHETFALYARKGADADLAGRCASLSRLLDRYRMLVRRRPLAEAVWQVFAETGCLTYVAGLPGGRQRRANLIKLHERARQFGTFARQGLYRFLEFMRRLEESGQDPGAALPAAESDNVVRIMSIHASKGLEFPVVVLPDLAKRFNFEDARGRMVTSREYFLGPKVVDDQLEIEYPTVAHALACDDVEAQTRAEEMRILYVAMTRARERLILVGTARLANVGPERLAAEWAGHDGPLPPLTVSAADSYLDWLLPALACQRSSPEAPFPDWLQMVTYPAEEIRRWELPRELTSDQRERRRRLADLLPLPADEPLGAGDDALVTQTLRRLRVSYRHDDLTAVPSVLAVTELKRRYDATRQLDDQTRELAYALPGDFPSPERGRRVHTDVPTDQVRDQDLAAERGTATHLLLQHMDLGAGTDPDKLNAEIERLADRSLLTRAQADLIDREAIGWFLQTRWGRSVRQAGDRLRREVMFVASIGPEMFDPAVRAAHRRDVVLIRGIIDALLIDQDGCQVIDYKTDRIGKDELAARAESYRPQMDLYARAAHELTARPVTARWLVFLAPRQVYELK